MELQLDQAIEILRCTPSTLSAFLRPLSNDWLEKNEGSDTWSPFDVVGHLIHGEETDWIPRAKIILTDGEDRPFESFDRFAMFEKSKGKTIGQLLDEFAHLRERNVEELEKMNLTSELLVKRGRHPELGVVSLKQLIATWVVHDLGHIAQVARVMAKQYRDEVGPWEQYLPVLNR